MAVTASTAGTPHPEITQREWVWLEDAVMVLMHEMEQVRSNDLSEMPELQVLLGKLNRINSPHLPHGNW